MRIFHSSAKNPVLHEIDKEVAGAWIYAEAPTAEELQGLSSRYNLDIDLLTDGIDPNESPRIERDGDVVYIYTRFTLPETEVATTAPMLIVYDPEVTITITQRPFTGLERFLDGSMTIYTSKRAQLVLQLLSEVVTGYKRRINQISRRIYEIRTLLKNDRIENRDFVKFLDIEEDLNDFLLVLQPMESVLTNLLNGRFMRLYEEDRDLIEDLQLGAVELTQLTQSRLNSIRNIRDAYSTITANNLNRIFRLMTAVTIVIGLFTLVTGFYGMNVHLPFAKNPDVYLVILLFMVACVGLFVYWLRNRLGRGVFF